MLHKNEEYKGTVGGLGSEGEGIIKTQGTTAFVPFCLTGEEISFKALKVKGNIAYGKLSAVLSPSADRVKPVCPVFGKCGGCDLQHMSYKAQLAFKRKAVENALSKIGGINFKVNDTVACGKEYGYRNKLAVPVGENGEVGFYARHSHRIVETDCCPIQPEWSKYVLSAVSRFAKEQGAGNVRHFVARKLDDKFIFALVVKKEIKADKLLKYLDEYFKEFTLVMNINSADTNVIYGNVWKTVKGEGFFGAEEFGIKYRAGANTFLQVNDEMRGKLYSAVLSEAEENCVAVDLYSGGGMLTAMLAKKCGLAYGVEIVQEASRCADGLKEQNGLQGKMFNICGKVEEKLSDVFKLTEGKRRVIVCDPPRKGMERSVVKAIANSGADKVILVSCNPATLARDTGLLTGSLSEKEGELVKSAVTANYQIESITPFDMFPQTKHIETLVVLAKKDL